MSDNPTNFDDLTDEEKARFRAKFKPLNRYGRMSASKPNLSSRVDYTMDNVSARSIVTGRTVNRVMIGGSRRKMALYAAMEKLANSTKPATESMRNLVIKVGKTSKQLQEISTELHKVETKMNEQGQVERIIDQQAEQESNRRKLFGGIKKKKNRKRQRNDKLRGKDDPASIVMPNAAPTIDEVQVEVARLDMLCNSGTLGPMDLNVARITHARIKITLFKRLKLQAERDHV